MRNVKVNDIVQINETGKKDWVGCLICVTEIKLFGIVGYARVPSKDGLFYIRVPFGEFEIIGQAALLADYVVYSGAIE